MKRDVSLILGSGGARGMAHIGVIRWLEDHGYTIRDIAGASIGAVVGGIYAAGKLQVFEQWVRGISRVDIVSYLDVAWGGGGLVKGEKIINTLTALVGDRRIEDLPIRFTAVATTLDRHEDVHFRSGRLFDAIRASMSMPLLFKPFVLDGVTYIDGAVLNPLPLNAVTRTSQHVAVAVYCGGAPVNPDASETDLDEGGPTATSMPAMLQDAQQRIRHFLKRIAPTEAQGSTQERAMYDVALQSLEAMQHSIARREIERTPPDVLLEIPRNICRTLEYDKASEVIAAGYAITEAALSKLDR